MVTIYNYPKTDGCLVAVKIHLVERSSPTLRIISASVKFLFGKDETSIIYSYNLTFCYLRTLFHILYTWKTENSF